MSMLFLLVAHNEDPKIVPQLLDQQFVYKYVPRFRDEGWSPEAVCCVIDDADGDLV